MAGWVLYGTVGCHLCDVAEQLLATTLDLQSVSIELVDIADDDRLVERYGIRIPVLADSQTGRELGWPFDSQQLLRFVAEQAD
ncbi:MAG: glutaredoxin family protein [Halopseudomonas sp.]